MICIGPRRCTDDEAYLRRPAALSVDITRAVWMYAGLSLHAYASHSVFTRTHRCQRVPCKCRTYTDYIASLPPGNGALIPPVLHANHTDTLFDSGETRAVVCPSGFVWQGCFMKSMLDVHACVDSRCQVRRSSTGHRCPCRRMPRRTTRRAQMLQCPWRPTCRVCCLHVRSPARQSFFLSVGVDLCPSLET